MPIIHGCSVLIGNKIRYIWLWYVNSAKLAPSNKNGINVTMKKTAWKILVKVRLENIKGKPVVCWMIFTVALLKRSDGQVQALNLI